MARGRVCGVGINDCKLDWSSSLVKRKYDCWRSMLSRCYRSNSTIHPTYVGCMVDSRWFYLSNFLEDMEKIPGYTDWCNNPGKYDLDKDSLVPGNRVYSLSTCIFLKSSDNVRERNNRLGHPSSNPSYNARAHLPDRNRKMAESLGEACYAVTSSGEVIKAIGYNELARKVGCSVAIISESCRGTKSVVKKKGKFKGWGFYKIGSGPYPEMEI